MTRILCVDDNENNVYLLRAILQRVGFEVLIAADGEQGVALARDEQPDLVLMDLVLPGIDGFEATRRIKALPGAIPVIALSAHEESEKGPLARAAGCDAYAHKPLQIRSLLEQIQRLLSPGGAAPAAEAPGEAG